MQKRSKAILISGSVVLLLGIGAVIAAPTIYRSLMSTPEVAPPTLQAEKPALAPGEGDPLTLESLNGQWHVTSDSTVGYRVNEQLRGEAITVVGQTNEVSGTIEVSDLILTAAKLNVDIASFQTDSTSRDTYFRDTTVRANDFPTATFTLTTPVALPAAPLAGEIFTQQFTGMLTLAGETNEVTLTAQARSDGETTEIVGKIPVTFSDFGITAPSLAGFVTVEETGLIEFDILMNRSMP